MKQINPFLKTIIALSMFLFIMISSETSKGCNANFTHTNGCVGDTVWFYAADLYAVYTWDFGDSTGQTNINHDTTTFHVYNTPGTYFVTLFVNIGAEWDIKTQIITIGTNCFFADFTYDCNGSGNIYFYDASVGGTSWSWNFGDPASGSNNISNLTNPSHSYSSSGFYSVTLISSNGIVSDTSIQNVY